MFLSGWIQQQQQQQTISSFNFMIFFICCCCLCWYAWVCCLDGMACYWMFGFGFAFLFLNFFFWINKTFACNKLKGNNNFFFCVKKKVYNSINVKRSACVCVCVRMFMFTHLSFVFRFFFCWKSKNVYQCVYVLFTTFSWFELKFCFQKQK